MFSSDKKDNKKTVNVTTPSSPTEDKQTDDFMEPASVDIPTDFPDFNPPKPAMADNIGSNNLLDIKRKALKEVSQLISTLDQPPEQLFRTIMMIIQETDNSDMLNKAYETAIKIQDEKVRAEALLTITNEINYFTNKESQKN